ncbi:MAG: hypothetical protein KY445_11555 [Armatimonadetes bacterium]|nr:hypothetical protein [Armatimonadota bacterium]
MTAAIAPTIAPTMTAGARARRSSKNLHRVRQLVWAYFWLLIFEGALRKWVLPFASNPLLIVRDPVVLLAYFYAWRGGLFPRNTFLLFGAALGLLSLAAGLIATEGAAFVTVYGFRAHFLQLPMIFLIAKVFDARDVQRVGYWVLLLSVPMALLMALQFLSPPQSVINSGAEENFEQLQSVMGRIRPAGTFSYISGPTLFFALVAVFILHSQISKRYPLFLTLAASLGLLVAAVVSGSRGLVGGIGVIFLFALLFGVFFKPRLAARWIGGFLVLLLLFYVIRNVPIIQLSLSAFTERLNSASGVEGGAEGFLSRVWDTLVGNAYPTLFHSPHIGHGLGVGTNVGAILLSGKAQFLLAESEWQRIIMESGPFLGGSFLLYRVVLSLWLGRLAILHAIRQDPLPLLLFSSCGLNLTHANLGQPTALGFVILSSGLCLAATRTVPQKRPSARPAPRLQSYRSPAAVNAPVPAS